MMNTKFAEFDEMYTVETLDHLINIESNILEIEKSGFDRDKYDAIMRDVHTMKGDSTFIGLPHIFDLCHRIEQTLSENGDWEEKEINKMVRSALAFVDTLRTLCDSGFESTDTADEPQTPETLQGPVEISPFVDGNAGSDQKAPQVVDEMILMRPLLTEESEWNDNLLQYLIDMRGSLANKTVVLDMVNFKSVPLSVFGWFFLLKEDLEKEGSRLILTGLAPQAISPAKREKALRHFDIQENFSGAVSRFANN